MKLVLFKDGVKREIETPFALCIGRGDLHQLIDELKFVAGGMDGSGSSYGWVRIDPSHPADCKPNTPPMPWSASDTMRANS